MKKNLLLISVIIGLMTVFCTGFSSVNAQSPQAFKYQAVARNLNGDPVIDQEIAVKISILSGSETGPVVYSELHEIPTNQMGLFTIEIGNATYVLFGNFSEIGWGYSTHFMKTEIDISGGSNYQLMGVSQLLSVPYALYANEAANAQNYTAGAGINVSDGVITNTAPDRNVTIGSGTGISATGAYPNFMVANTSPNATHTGDATGGSELTVGKIQGRSISTTAPSNGEVLQWNMFTLKWEPAADDNTTYTAGSGINVAGTIISNTAPDQTVVLTGGTGIGTSGTYPNFTVANTAPNATHTGDATGGSVLTVEKIRGRTVSSTAPTTNQVLQWNGSQWTPTTLAAQSDDWKLTGNSGTSPTTNFIGTTDNAALQFKVSNAKAGWIEQWYGSNTCFGYESLRDVTSGQFNTALGNMALRQNTEGKYNTALGDQSLESNTIGKYNTSCGYVAMVSNTTGENNSSFGWASLYDNTSGSSNTAIGSRTLANNTTGFSNVAIGSSALYHNTTQSQIVAIGDSALFNNGVDATTALHATKNTAVGSKALFANTTGNSNTATGVTSLSSNTTGFNNTANGYNALTANTIGFQNTASGVTALCSNTEGECNTAKGYSALYSNTTGSLNTALGYVAGNSGATHNQCTFIGASTNLSTIRTNVTLLGFGVFNAQCTANNQVLLGNTAVTQIRANVTGITAYSDERYKTNVKENVAGLGFILKLKPVTYNLNPNELHKIWGTPDSLVDKMDFSDAKKEVRIGFVAQDVEKAAKESGFDFPGIDVPKNDKEVYSLRYTDFIMPLVKAMQEQQKMIAEMQQKNEELQKQIDDLKAILKK